jgi:hypothetical protein
VDFRRPADISSYEDHASPLRSLSIAFGNLGETVASSPTKLSLVNHTFVVIKRAFCPVLAALTGRRHSADDRVNSGANIDVRAVRHECDFVADSELKLGQ